jgi:hypothetical protein
MTPGIDPESEIQNESQMSESYNKTTETESERSINIDRFRKNFGPGFTKIKCFVKIGYHFIQIFTFVQHTLD